MIVIGDPSLGKSLGYLRGLNVSKANPCEQQARASLMTQPKKRLSTASS